MVSLFTLPTLTTDGILTTVPEFSLSSPSHRLLSTRVHLVKILYYVYTHPKGISRGTDTPGSFVQRGLQPPTSRIPGCLIVLSTVAGPGCYVSERRGDKL